MSRLVLLLLLVTVMSGMRAQGAAQAPQGRLETEEEKIARLTTAARTARTGDRAVDYAEELRQVRSERIIPGLIYALRHPDHYRKYAYSSRFTRSLERDLNKSSLGFFWLAGKCEEHWEYRAFLARQNKIVRHLERLTGNTANGLSFKRWKRWALFHGYELDGDTIELYLRDDDDEVRRRAFTAATKLLGYENLDAYLSASSSARHLTEEQQATAMMIELGNKGLIRREPGTLPTGEKQAKDERKQRLQAILDDMRNRRKTR